MKLEYNPFEKSQMSETPAKQFSRCRLGDIVYYENAYVFITSLNSQDMIIMAEGMILNNVEVNLKDREKLTYPIPKPIPDDIIQKRNEYMYEWSKTNQNNTTTATVSVSVPSSNSSNSSNSRISVPVVSNLLRR